SGHVTLRHRRDPALPRPGTTLELIRDLRIALTAQARVAPGGEFAPPGESPCPERARSASSSSLALSASARRGRRGGGGRGGAAPGRGTDGGRRRPPPPMRPGSSASTGAAQAPTTTQMAAPLNQVTSASDTPKNPN